MKQETKRAIWCMSFMAMAAMLAIFGWTMGELAVELSGIPVLMVWLAFLPDGRF